MNTQLIALQLWSVREFFTPDYKDTVRKVAAMGYKGVEFAGGYGGMTAPELKAFLDECGLQPVGSHVPYGDLLGKMDEVIEYHLTVGNRYIVCPGAPLKTKDDFFAVRDNFNRFGEQCKKSGLLFGYHNHAHEFQSFDGQVGYDILVEGTDPDLVFYEMDTCWVQVGGYDPVDYCKKYPGRFKLCHIKDYLNERNEKGHVVQTDIGKGEMDFKKVIPALKENGCHYLII
ncbi:MAG TPA: sugar phosphate isomerase/epimerase, partial [Clostridiales bacterium]|nr:sugar phosphate isomerase/epimerase [Clostridiales bacterium]